jgi:hypothetical protein
MTFPKPHTYRSEKYLDYVRSLPCAVGGCGHKAEPHHTEGGGVGRKGSDLYAIPLCRMHHQAHNTIGRFTFYINVELDRWEVVARTLAGYMEKEGV